MTHDYKRNGTAVLFAARQHARRSVMSMCDDQHRHQEWLKFLRVIDDVTAPDKDLHLIADNYSTHKHPEVRFFGTIGLLVRCRSRAQISVVAGICTQGW